MKQIQPFSEFQSLPRDFLDHTSFHTYTLLWDNSPGLQDFSHFLGNSLSTFILNHLVLDTCIVNSLGQ